MDPKMQFLGCATLFPDIKVTRLSNLQGDAGGVAVGYVDLDFQVPPVCPLALPIQP